MAVKYRFLICVFLAYLVWIGHASLFGNLVRGSFLLTPGFFFSLAIALSVEERVIKRIIFAIVSTAIYFLALRISFINAYWGPDLQYLIIGSVAGALLEILNFYFVFKISGRLKILHLLLGIIIGAVSFVFTNAGNGLGTYAGFAMWQGGIAFVLYKMYSQNKAHLSAKTKQ